MFNFEEANLKGKEAIDAALKNYAGMTKSLQEIATEATDYTKKSFEDGVAHFEKLAGAKSIEEAFELQSAYVKTAFEKFVAQSTKMTEMYTDLAKDAYKPYETAVTQVKETAQEAA
ncbi:phasin family protein [Rhizobium sp. L1K21]|uniref:phasin family protein n=1 Tax=Rhizobium sp. L1K21 TaxID=2954933 RepID=UPI002092CCA8|nr:phasin family protein [Rhizobium sp. L1K21]MCO6185976.1 phasin family protein [Rhizobium sp. L1K21]